MPGPHIFTPPGCDLKDAKVGVHSAPGGGLAWGGTHRRRKIDFCLKAFNWKCEFRAAAGVAKMEFDSGGDF